MISKRKWIMKTLISAIAGAILTCSIIVIATAIKADLREQRIQDSGITDTIIIRYTADTVYLDYCNGDVFEYPLDEFVFSFERIK